MPIRIYNTLTQRKEPFEPIVPGRAGIYACGVTVYDACHIGHARSALVFEVMRRYLAYRGYRVTFVRNFTDVEDKIIQRAAETGRAWKEVADQYVEEFRQDMRAFGLPPADHEPRATEYIGEMLRLIEALVARGLAYPVDGDVYFEVRKFPAYGQLSHRRLDELRAGARVEADERKRDPLDFALWKASKPGEPWWDSPWGRGRPGWHIECSAMSVKLLGGQPFDIHGGGADLIFPHHENELAQSEGAAGVPLARTWAHHGLVNLKAAKMSKSLGNIVGMRALLREHSATAVKLFLLQTHYRSPVDFSPEAVGRAARALRTFFEPFVTVEGLSPVEGAHGPAPPGQVRERVEQLGREFEEAMDDDFNTPRAVAALFRLVGSFNGWLHALRPQPGPSPAFLEAARDGARRVRTLWEAVLGLEWQVPSLRGLRPAVVAGAPAAAAPGIVPDASSVFRCDAAIASRIDAGKLATLLAKHGDPDGGGSTDRPAVEACLARLHAIREAARRRRDFRTSDAIRSDLAALGIEVRDRQAGGSEWRWSGRGG
jgi:cysteinyl-tRNA synthetase